MGIRPTNRKQVAARAMVLITCLGFGFFSLLAVAGQEPARPGATGEVLKAPGPETKAVVNFLNRIKEGRAKADLGRGDMIVRGRVSGVHGDWKEGMAELTPDQLPAPEWCQFVLVHKGEKRALRFPSRLRHCRL